MPDRTMRIARDEPPEPGGGRPEPRAGETSHEPGCVAEYRLARPSADEAQASLARVLGHAESRTVWREGCAAGGVSAASDPDLDSLRRVAVHLVGRGGAAAVAGRSLEIRIRAYVVAVESSGAGPTEDGR